MTNPQHSISPNVDKFMLHFWDFGVNAALDGDNNYLCAHGCIDQETQENCVIIHDLRRDDDQPDLLVSESGVTFFTKGEKGVTTPFSDDQEPSLVAVTFLVAALGDGWVEPTCSCCGA